MILRSLDLYVNSLASLTWVMEPEPKFQTSASPAETFWLHFHSPD